MSVSREKWDIEREQDLKRAVEMALAQLNVQLERQVIFNPQQMVAMMQEYPLSVGGFEIFVRVFEYDGAFAYFYVGWGGPLREYGSVSLTAMVAEKQQAVAKALRFLRGHIKGLEYDRTRSKLMRDLPVVPCNFYRSK
jgi:hypothetical protein